MGAIFNFPFLLFGTKSIIPHGAKNVNTFLKNIFHFLPSAGNGGIWGKIPATFGEKRVAENEKKKSCFFLIKKEKSVENRKRRVERRDAPEDGNIRRYGARICG